MTSRVAGVMALALTVALASACTVAEPVSVGEAVSSPSDSAKQTDSEARFRSTKRYFTRLSYSASASCRVCFELSPGSKPREVAVLLHAVLSDSRMSDALAHYEVGIKRQDLLLFVLAALCGVPEPRMAWPASVSNLEVQRVLAQAAAAIAQNPPWCPDVGRGD